MSDNPLQPLQTEAYKGVRDFYPEDAALEQYLFTVWQRLAESYGYVLYNASLLEPTELYKAKTGEEIMNEQTYSFTDRGGRSVTLRPEMTPTIARMVAKKQRELSLPLRWYSIPNVFRYERPQRGRLREHWQLNADIFGVSSTAAEIEIITLANDIMKAFGAKTDDFEIRVNSRRLLQATFQDFLVLDDTQSNKLSKLIDKRSKMKSALFAEEMQTIAGDKAEKIHVLLDVESLDEYLAQLPDKFKDSRDMQDIERVIKALEAIGIQNVIFDFCLVRGFDYYTGIVFEIFDTDPKNNRSLFGGGRYDNLLEIFGKDTLPAVGFGMGDVTMQDFLETHALLPDYRSPTDIFICTIEPTFLEHANLLARNLRTKGVNVAVNFTDKKVPDQIAYADKKKIPYILCIGETELGSDEYTIKELATGEEQRMNSDAIPPHILKRRA